jgi:hypothetical protein
MTTCDLHRGIFDFKKVYQPRTNIVQDEKGDLFTDSQSILAMWRNHFSQLFSVHGISDVRQTKIHAAEPLVPRPSAFEFQMAIEKLKEHKSPDIDQISELITASGSTIRSEILKIINSIWNKEEFPEE